MTEPISFTVGSSPSDESCAQLGSPDYSVRVTHELAAYRKQLERLILQKWNEIPPTFKLVTRGNRHDFGTYYELAVQFPLEDTKAAEIASWLDENLPAEWDAEARQDLGLDVPN